MRHYGLEEDHLRLLDHGLNHLHGGAESPGFEGRGIIPRLQKSKTKESSLLPYHVSKANN